MKKIVGLAFILVLGMAAPAYAQSTAMVDGTPKLAQLAEKLNFSETQKQQLNGLLKKYSTEAQSIQVQARALRGKMQTLTMSDLDKAKVESFAVASGKLAEANTRALLDTQREFYRLLSARQKNQYAKLRAEALSKSQAGK